MRPQTVLHLRKAFLALAGVPPAFFFVFNAVFTDTSSVTERLVSFALNAAVYGIGGVLAGLWTGSWRSGLWLSAAAVVILALYSLRESHRLLLHAAVLVMAVGPACLGAYAGSWVRARRRRNPRARTPL